VAVIWLRFSGDTEAIRACPELVRLDKEIGVGPFDPDTELLVASSRALPGFFESNGEIFSKGPYIFTARVWLRK
jgi:hypothetical protein